MPQPQIKPRSLRRALQAVVVLLGGVTAAWGADSPGCTRALGTPQIVKGPLKTVGTTPTAVEVPLVPGHTYLIEVAERGNDAVVDTLGPDGKPMVHADNPEPRTGTHRAIATGPDSGTLVVRITGKEHDNLTGSATVRVFDLAVLSARPECLGVLKSLAAADADYAAGQDIFLGHAASAGASARSAYLRAVDEYSAAERALTAPGDRQLRAEIELALASAEYFGVEDWAKTADWAKAAADTFGPGDPYRRARSRTLLAEAWIEIGKNVPADHSGSERDTRRTELMTSARSLLESLRRFHQQRGETYDAALQVNNIAVTYFYASRFADCVTTLATASRLFGSVHETQRRAQAWHNEALCLWGLGRLPEALQWFERALADIGPQPYPDIHVYVMNNTALANYAMHRFDESLRLFDAALHFAREIQLRNAEAQSLYGIGVNYYALGDLARAREFLADSLEIRTVALDRRGRMTSLRALANIDAEEGKLEEALRYDREAMSLAVAPTAVSRTAIQLAMHTAAAGNIEDAKAQLDGVIATGTRADPLVQAEALLQRAVLLRTMGRLRDALADLERARVRLHRLGNVTEEFQADLERARTLRLLGQPDGALAAVERALGQADALRQQTANPEFRTQLQMPLRPAYDLKIELLRAAYEKALAAGRRQEADALAADAFETADSSRARTLGDVAAEEYPPGIRRELAAQLRRREQLYGELAGRRFALEGRFDAAGSGDARAMHLMSDIAEIERQIDTINTQIAERAAPKVPGPGAAHTAGHLPTIPVGTALMSYWLGSDSAYVWVVRPQEIRWTRLASPAAITDAATEFYGSLTRLVDVPPEQRLKEGQALYEMILRPIQPALSDAPQWVVIPDGGLDYVPFAALRTSDAGPDQFVAAHHDIALTPAAWMLESPKRRPQPRSAGRLLLVADPVYQADDPRLAGLPRAPDGSHDDARGDPAARDYQRLPFTAEEAAGIAALFPPSDVDRLIGLDATRERLLALDWSRYRFIHIAAHATVDPQVPELSALVLGSYDASGQRVDGAVRVADLSLRTLHADIAVFSACDTALGKQTPSEGLVGIASTVLARGAHTVVASLWPVSDEIGAHLMTEFYGHLLHDAMSPPAALGAAMRSIVLRDNSADPALWAAYQVSVVSLGPGPPVRDAGVAKSSPQ